MKDLPKDNRGMQFQEVEKERDPRSNICYYLYDEMKKINDKMDQDSHAIETVEECWKGMEMNSWNDGTFVCVWMEKVRE